MATSQMTDLIHLIKSEASRLRDFMAGLDEDSWSARSACDGWRLRDVAAHLTTAADTWANTITRGVAGDADPPQGQSFLTPGDRGSEATAQRAVDLSRQLGDGLLDEFTAGYDRLFAILDGLKAEDWEKPCFHRRGPMPMHDYVALRLQELALHGWDMRSGLDESAELYEDCMPTLITLLPRWLRNAFTPGLGLPTPMRFRFEIPGPLPMRQDILVNHDDFVMEGSGDSRADVTVHCDTSSYILLIYGRFNLDWASVIGKATIEGRREQATIFTTWFRGF